MIKRPFDLWSLNDDALITQQDVLDYILPVSIGTLYRMEARNEFVTAVYPSSNRKFYRAGDVKEYMAGLADRAGVKQPRAKPGPKPKVHTANMRMADMERDWLKQRKMTAKQYQQALDDLGLTQVGAGEFLGVSERTARRYVSGETEVPVAVALLLRRLIMDGRNIFRQ